MLQAGAQRARALATPLLARLRSAVGLRSLVDEASASKASSKAAKVALPSFKQYRERDGQFYFKLLDAQGQLLLQSVGLASPQLAGQSIAQLRSQGAAALPALQAQLQPVDGVQPSDIASALQQLIDAAQA